MFNVLIVQKQVAPELLQLIKQLEIGIAFAAFFVPAKII